jgi:hypothetical protein
MSEQINGKDQKPRLLIVVGPFDDTDLEILKRNFPTVWEIDTLADRQEEWDAVIASVSRVAVAARKQWGERDPAMFLFQDGGITPFNNPALLV